MLKLISGCAVTGEKFTQQSEQVIRKEKELYLMHV